MFPILIENECYLRLFENNDADELFNKVDSLRDYLKKWLPWVYKCNSVSDSEKFISKKIDEWKNKQSLALAIIKQNKIVGAIELHKFDWKQSKTSIGCWVCPYKGRGMARKATKILLKIAFEVLDLKIVEAMCAIENKASKAVIERLKFDFSGVRKNAESINGHLVDWYVYELKQCSYEKIYKNEKIII